MKFALGDKLKDRITGYEGVCIARTEWINNCKRYTLQPQKLGPEGKPVEAVSFDEYDLDLVEVKDPPAPEVKHGGPRPEPKRW